jgi:hypothetical protein
MMRQSCAAHQLGVEALDLGPLKRPSLLMPAWPTPGRQPRVQQRSASQLFSSLFTLSILANRGLVRSTVKAQCQMPGEPSSARLRGFPLATPFLRQGWPDVPRTNFRTAPPRSLLALDPTVICARLLGQRKTRCTQQPGSAFVRSRSFATCYACQETAAGCVPGFDQA